MGVRERVREGERRGDARQDNVASSSLGIVHHPTNPNSTRSTTTSSSLRRDIERHHYCSQSRSTNLVRDFYKIRKRSARADASYSIAPGTRDRASETCHIFQLPSFYLYTLYRAKRIRRVHDDACRSLLFRFREFRGLGHAVGSRFTRSIGYISLLLFISAYRRATTRRGSLPLPFCAGEVGARLA